MGYLFRRGSMPVLLLVLLGYATAASVPGAVADEANTALRQVSDGLGSFSIRFFQEISKQKKGQNLITSPLSADVVLSMAAMGAAGNTEAQMRQALHLPSDREVTRQGFRNLLEDLNNVENVTLELANKMYLAKGLELEPEFRELTSGSFKSEASELDVSQPASAAKLVNDWVNDKTHSKIQRILKDDDIGADTRMILLNAVYFKGSWAQKFKPEDTQERAFHLSTKSQKKVPTMFVAGNFLYGELPDLKAKFVELPYSSEDLKMVIIVPDEIDGLGQLIDKLDAINGSRLAKSGYARDVQLYLPKFKVESEIDLEEPLRKLGMSDMFENQANFSGISKEPLKVGKVLQKAFIEVNEEGSEAAAVTAIHAMELSASVPEPEAVVLDVNRPFLYKIVNIGAKDELAELTLFTGSVSEP